MNQYTKKRFNSNGDFMLVLKENLLYYGDGKVVCCSYVHEMVFYEIIIILTKLFENIVSIVDCGNHKLNFCEFPIQGLLLLDVLKYGEKKNEGKNISQVEK